MMNKCVIRAEEQREKANLLINVVHEGFMKDTLHEKNKDIGGFNRL